MHNWHIGSPYRQKGKSHSQCPILEMSINRASMIYNFAAVGNPSCNWLQTSIHEILPAMRGQIKSDILHQQNVLESLKASSSVSEKAECKLGSVNVSQELEHRRALWQTFWVSVISNIWYVSTTGGFLICFGVSGTVVQPMQESQTNSGRYLESNGHWFNGLQALSGILLLYTSNKNTLHI
jgi:hypothetical protein